MTSSFWLENLVKKHPKNDLRNTLFKRRLNTLKNETTASKLVRLFCENKNINIRINTTV